MLHTKSFEKNNSLEIGNEMDMKVIIGDSQDMHELQEDSVQLVVTSPPYFNAPFDYPGLFESYPHFFLLTLVLR